MPGLEAALSHTEIPRIAAGLGPSHDHAAAPTPAAGRQHHQGNQHRQNPPHDETPCFRVHAPGYFRFFALICGALAQPSSVEPRTHDFLVIANPSLVLVAQPDCAARLMKGNATPAL